MAVSFVQHKNDTIRAAKGQITQFVKWFLEYVFAQITHILGNFCKGVKILHFSWNHLWVTFIDIWRLFSSHTGCKRFARKKIRQVARKPNSVWSSRYFCPSWVCFLFLQTHLCIFDDGVFTFEAFFWPQIFVLGWRHLWLMMPNTFFTTSETVQ